MNRNDIQNHLGYEFRILSIAAFQYIDYQEIVVARKSSRMAFWLSIIAIAISLIFGIIQTAYLIKG